MTPAETRLTEALAVLAALRSMQDTRDKDTWSACWAKAWDRALAAAKLYLEETQ